MTDAELDLAALDTVDLAALRLGAQVMGYKAGLAGRPRVEVFFGAIRVGVDTELARRGRSSDGLEILPLIVRMPSAVEGPAATSEDRAVAAEYLALLCANPRLSEGVRAACETLRVQLEPAG